MGVSLYLFGPPRIENDGAPVAVSRRKALALLAYLAADGRAHSREHLAALLWPEWDGSAARTALRRVLVTAKKAVGPGALMAEQARLSLPEGGRLWVDVREFRQALQRSRSHRHAHLHTCDDCLGWLNEAATLYTGDFLAGFGLPDTPEVDDWITFEAESLRRDAAEALEKLAQIHAAPRNFAQAIAYARRWLALDPLHEPAHQMLIRLHAGAGDVAAALRQYNECTDLLRRELGLSPSPETNALSEAIHHSQFTVHPFDRLRTPHLQFSSPLPQRELGVSPSPEAKALAEAIPQSPVRLPRQPDFVGRWTELARLTALLADPSQRLVTVVGLGGMGKSYLALAAAAQAADGFPDGAAFVHLAPVTEPNGLVFAIAGAIDYNFPPDRRPPLEQLTGYLACRRLLLLLDNFEHLLDGASVVAGLVEAAPDVTFLVTSREPLRLRAETLFALEGMETDDEEGIRLFIQSARRVRPGHTPQRAQRAAIEEICRLVGGMPLGIVLAAGWMGLLTPNEIAAEIRRGLDVLAMELRDAPERQRSIHIVLEQTWARLNDAERDVLIHLSIFRGGFTREAAQEVTGASLGTLLALANRQLLQRSADGRYDIHELLRQFSQERLAGSGLAEDAAQRHGSYFVALLERSEGELKGADQPGALTRLRAAHDNIHIAWAWALDHRPAESLVQAVEALSLFYFLDQRRSAGLETLQFTEGRLAETAPDSVSLARLLVWYAKFCEPVGQMEKGKILCRRSLQILDGLAADGRDMRRERAFVLWELGGLVWYDNIVEARQLLAESVALCREVNDLWQLAGALRESARLRLMDGEYRISDEMAAEGLEIREKLGDQRQRSSLLSILCWAALNQDQPDRALVYAQECIKLGEQLVYPEIVSYAKFLLGNIHSHKGEYDEAQRTLLDALTLAQQYEHRHHANSCRWELAEIYVHTGDYQAAYDLARVAVNEAEAIGLRNHKGHALRSWGMAETVWAHSVEALRSLEESVRILQTIRHQRLLAYGQVFLAWGYYRSVEKERVAGLLSAVLGWATEHPSSETLTACLPLAALLHADAGQPERAVELYALAWSYPRIANSRWFYDVAGKKLEALAGSLPPAVVAAAQERGRGLDLFGTARGLVAWLGVEEE